MSHIDSTDTIIFVTCDIVALVVQAIGGARASIAVQTGGDAEKGAKIMVAGIIFQLAAISIYTLLAAEFLMRYYTNRPVRRREAPVEHKVRLNTRLSLMILGLFISTLFIYIRSIYRTIELLDGWTGPIITNQLYFNVLDGMPIIVAIYALNLLHPGYLLNRESEGTVVEEKDARKSLD
ncbi:RTA1-like protein [Ceratobasidium sp. AG-Ba]|nr:RTA1-like protein [Ceratobasidium sp. AG-Ba]